ncbi:MULTISPECIES: GNAT family N-acetyltransferase [unclassified Bradyrhizobium]|uniref:GNAT family N-acetyltransferase n=1 Tax=unclassified Bradyrhizobium TaxID=2631580 RepID=UPI0028EE4C0E|nr:MULTISPECIES: GNAT family N-acetyltransferase [unclassified Bradyrhizobium]
MNLGFRPMTEGDLPAIRDWLQQPHIREWWGDPDEQYALIDGDRAEPAMGQYIILMEGEAAGYLQCYALTAWNDGFGPQPDGTRGIDLFIAGHERIGRGHGPLALRTFCGLMFQRGVPRVVTDPSPTHARAIRAYEKAGFRRERLVDTPDGPALLMSCDPADLPRRPSEPS